MDRMAFILITIIVLIVAGYTCVLVLESINYNQLRDSCLRNGYVEITTIKDTCYCYRKEGSILTLVPALSVKQEGAR